MSEKVQEVQDVKSEMIYLLIKDDKKVRTWNTMETRPNIPEGRYAVRKEDSQITITKIAGNVKKANVNTVKVNGINYMAKTGKEGQLILTPAPEISTFDIAKNKDGKVDLRTVCASVRLFIKEHEEKGIFGVFHADGQLFAERLR